MPFLIDDFRGSVFSHCNETGIDTPKRKATPQGLFNKKITVQLPAIVRKQLLLPYNKFKNFKGSQYTGMKMGRSHNGIMTTGMKETKTTPGLWGIHSMEYQTKSGQGAGRVRCSSGNPNTIWYFMAHQMAT